MSPTILTTLKKLLQSAEQSATMADLSIGFPNERITIAAVHFPDPGFDVGDQHHPTDYIRDRTKLYRETWILPQLREAIRIVEANEQLFNECERLAKTVESLNLERVQKLASAGMGR